MSQEDFFNTDWKHHDIVLLTNGKEYVVQKQKKRYILLLSTEYEAYFTVDHKIIVDRTYDSVHRSLSDAYSIGILQSGHRSLVERYMANKHKQ